MLRFLIENGKIMYEIFLNIIVLQFNVYYVEFAIVENIFFLNILMHFHISKEYGVRNESIKTL